LILSVYIYRAKKLLISDTLHFLSLYGYRPYVQYNKAIDFKPKFTIELCVE